jgi:hypothetical protein
MIVRSGLRRERARKIYQNLPSVWIESSMTVNLEPGEGYRLFRFGEKRKEI